MPFSVLCVKFTSISATGSTSSVESASIPLSRQKWRIHKDVAGLCVAVGPFGESVVSVNPAHRVAELGRSLGAEGIARKTLRTRLHIAEGWIGFGGHVGFPPKTPRVQRRAQRTSVRYGVDTPRPAQWSSTKARKASLLSRARATLRRPMSTFFALSKS